MKNYLDLRVTSAQVRVELELLGGPDYTVTIDGITKTSTTIVHWVSLTKPFAVEVDLRSNGIVIIKSLTVDGIELVPKYDYLASYLGYPTSHLDKVGKWTLTFDRPFYQWYHQATKQGWLLEP